MIDTLLSVIEIYKNRNYLLLRQDFVPWRMRCKEINHAQATDFCAKFSTILFSTYLTLSKILSEKYGKQIAKNILEEAIEFYQLILDTDRQAMFGPRKSYCGELLRLESNKLKEKSEQIARQAEIEIAEDDIELLTLLDLRNMAGIQSMALRECAFYLPQPINTTDTSYTETP